MFKISHETPITLLKESLRFNDYQYCLVHLLEENNHYLNHFEYCRDNDINILMDNSIFELGEAFEMGSYKKWIDIIKPQEYIIPDVLGDNKNTIKFAKKWLDEFDIFNGKTLPIGVIHGNTYREIVYCLKEMRNMGIKKYAFPFISKLYDEIKDPNILIRQKHGRIKLIEDLINDGYLNTNDKVHLLGSSLPSEFIEYSTLALSIIDSIDTSNPIMMGYERILYNDNLDHTYKPSQKLFKIIDKEICEEQRNNIINNVQIFRDVLTK